jgi:hypothetical protein
VKTRGSDHDRGTYAISVAKGGMRVGPQVRDLPAPRTEIAEGKKELPARMAKKRR